MRQVHEVSDQSRRGGESNLGGRIVDLKVSEEWLLQSLAAM